MIKTIVIFANSVKHNQHCVAGKDIITKEWIRPVGDKNGCELRDEQTKYQNPYGKFLVKPLQKIIIDFLDKAPLKQQPENYIISNNIWQQNYKIERENIKFFLDYPNNLWLDGISYNDRVNYTLIQSENIIINQSLYLIEVEKIHIYWKNRSNFRENSQRRGFFKYNNISYDLPITDPNFKNFQEQDLENKFLCISLGEEYKGYCYKLIASIL